MKSDVDGADLSTQNPWPFVSDYFLLESANAKNPNILEFRCVLCAPNKVIIKGHRTSLSNLKSHIRRKHPTQVVRFNETMKCGSNRGKHLSRSNGHQAWYESFAHNRSHSILSEASFINSTADDDDDEMLLCQSAMKSQIVDSFTSNMLLLHVNAQMQNDAEGASTSFAVGEQVEGLCYEEGVTTNNPDTAKNPKPTGNDCAQKANNSSDKSERLKNEKNKQNSGPIRGDTNLQNSSGSETKDSDNDDDSMDSEQVTTEDSSSPANSPSSKLEQNNNVSTNDNDEIFSMIRARVESKPKRKRLQYIRKLKRQLNYFIEMQEVRELSARLPDNVKFNDIFHN